MKYRLNFFQNMFDNCVDISEDYTWPEMVELFSAHSVETNKDGLSFNCCKFKTEDYRPAEFEEKDFITDEIIERRPIMTGGVTHVGRYRDNVIEYDCLVFDYDGDIGLEEAVEIFSSYTHLGYTSYNHVVKGNDRFRVILPLKSPIPLDELDRRKKSILEFSRDDDRSTLNIARLFYMPSHAAGNEEHAFVWNIDGVLCDWHDFKAEEVVTTALPVRTVAGVKSGAGKVIWESFDIVQFFKDNGLYVKPTGSGKHNVKCPNINHEGGGTVIFDALPGEFARFYCAHKSCVGFKFYDHFREKLGKGWMKDWCLREPEITEQDLINKFRIKGR